MLKKGAELIITIQKVCKINVKSASGKALASISSTAPFFTCTQKMSYDKIILAYIDTSF